MSRFREEIKVIPTAAWLLAAGAYLAISGFVLVMTSSPGPDDWPTGVRILFGILMPLFPAVYVLLVGYVYCDAKRRGMQYVMWTLLAALLPSAIGFILYFILRDPLLEICPKCGKNVSTGFPFCSACGTALAQTCPECRRPVKPIWSHCAQCGARLGLS